MEQTIGKRIMTLRKSRGMTQEELAEKLGVTAQAVSKWENDISCPDIALLPKLAEIFQVTTDSLLGMPEKTEIVKTPPKSGGFHVNIGDEEDEPDEERNGFTFRWDMNNGELPWFAMGVLLFAVAMLLNRTILAPLGEASVWSLMWPSAVLALGLSNLWEKISLWSGGTTIIGAYFLLTNMGILHLNLRPRWNIIILVLLIIWAVSMLLDNFRHGKKHAEVKGKGASAYKVKDGRVSYDGSFASETVTASVDLFRGGNVDLSFGSCTLDLRGCKDLEDGCILETDVSFGSLSVLVPKQWRVEDHTDRSFSSITFQGGPAPDAGQTLTLKSDVSFGSLEIRWED